MFSGLVGFLGIFVKNFTFIVKMFAFSVNGAQIRVTLCPTYPRTDNCRLMVQLHCLRRTGVCSRTRIPVQTEIGSTDPNASLCNVNMFFIVQYNRWVWSPSLSSSM